VLEHEKSSKERGPLDSRTLRCGRLKSFGPEIELVEPAFRGIQGAGWPDRGADVPLDWARWFLE